MVADLEAVLRAEREATAARQVSDFLVALFGESVSDPRAAEQLSALIVLPLILLVVGQSVGLILIDRQVILLIGLVVAILDIVLVILTVQLFERETILTRWK